MIDFTKNKTNGFHLSHYFYGFTNNRKPKFNSPSLEKRVHGCLTFTTDTGMFYSDNFCNGTLFLNTTTVRNKRD